MKRLSLVVTILMTFVMGCGGEATTAHNDCGDAGADIVVDASPPTDVVDVMSEETGVIPRPPYVLTIQILLPGEEVGIQNVMITRRVLTGPNLFYTPRPTNPSYLNSEYEPVGTEIAEVTDESVVIRVSWISPYNDAGDLGTSGSLLRNTVTQAYSYHGEVSVTDQFHRVWVGYPVNLKNTEDLFTEYMPGPCRRPYIARRNHLCVL